MLPSIIIAYADSIEELITDKVEHELLAIPSFSWESNRIGASTPPLELEHGQWLLPYHAKQDADIGYTQSFMILGPAASGKLEVLHRCSDRVLYADSPWELEGEFTTPCLFTCGAIRIKDELVMSYGAADTTSGIARTSFSDLVDYIRTFDADGNGSS